MTIEVERPNNTDPGVSQKRRESIPTLGLLSDDATKESRPFPFMGLPKELRLTVYSYLSAFAYKPIDCVSISRFGYWPIYAYPPSLLLVSRTIHAEAMDSINDRYAPIVACRPNHQQKYRAIQIALQLGYELDRAWLEKNAARGSNTQRISQEAVETAT